MELKINSKLFAGLVLFVSWAIIIAILIAGLVFYQESKQDTINNSLNNTNQQTSKIDTSSLGNITLDMPELAKHSTSKDCWMLINGKIYDFSSYLYNHPGGIYTITPYCGKDGTQAFATKDKGAPHSSSANAMLADYYIGDLNQKISQEIVQQRVKETATNNNSVSGNRLNREDDEYDDD